MEKYLADRSYALIYRMCQVQVFSSRLHARGFPAIGKYEPKTPPRTAGVTKCAIGFGRCSGFVRRFCREGPILRNPETGRTSLPRSRTRGCSALSPAAFPVLSPGAWYISGRIQYPGDSSCFFSLVFRRVAGMQPAGGFHRKPSAADRSDAEPARNAGSCPAGRAAGLHPSRRLVDRRRRHPIPLGRIRQSYISLLWRAYPPRSCDISQPRLEAHRPCLRPFPATRSLPTEESSRAKAGTSGHMIRDGDGLRVVSGISVRFPFSARRGRPLRAA